jgi:hypothetical protein
MPVPKHIREELSQIIWKEADELDWIHLNIHEKSGQYKIWAKDERIGQILSRYMSVERVHPYIKDSLLKPYAKSKKLERDDVLELLGLGSKKVAQEYIKPLGFSLEDGKIICWGRALDWKIVLLSTFERAQERTSYEAFSVILTDSHGKFSSMKYQNIVQDASTKLGIESIHFTK